MGKVKEPQAEYIVDKKGHKKSVILPIEEYEKLLEDLNDLGAAAMRKDEPSIPWEKVKKRLKDDGLLN